MNGQTTLGDASTRKVVRFHKMKVMMIEMYLLARFHESWNEH